MTFNFRLKGNAKYVISFFVTNEISENEGRLRFSTKKFKQKLKHGDLLYPFMIYDGNDIHTYRIIFVFIITTYADKVNCANLLVERENIGHWTAKQDSFYYLDYGPRVQVLSTP